MTSCIKHHYSHSLNRRSWLPYQRTEAPSFTPSTVNIMWTFIVLLAFALNLLTSAGGTVQASSIGHQDVKHQGADLIRAGFAAGTEVSISDGVSLPIDRVSHKHLVWSIEDDSSWKGSLFSALRLSAINQLVYHCIPEHRVVNVTWTHSDNDQSAWVLSSITQLYWVVNTGWVAASDLMVGDTLSTRGGQLVVVYMAVPGGSVDSKHVLCLHSFEVDTTHTYYVGASGLDVLVHNPTYGPVRTSRYPVRAAAMYKRPPSTRASRPPLRYDPSPFPDQVRADFGQIGEVGPYERAMKEAHKGLDHNLNHMPALSARGTDDCVIAMSKKDHALGASYGNANYNSALIGPLVQGGNWEQALLYEAHDLAMPLKGGAYEHDYRPFIESLLQCHVDAGNIDGKQLGNIMKSVRSGRRPFPV
jgi:hypothetical protein